MKAITEHVIQSQTEPPRYLTIEVIHTKGMSSPVKVLGECTQQEREFFEDWGTLVAENNPGHRPKLPNGWHYQGSEQPKQIRENREPYDFSGVLEGDQLEEARMIVRKKLHLY
jgi:hypothetical protein